MPSDSVPFGPDTLVVPAYLVSDPDDPAYLQWLQDHPDAFVAGTWTSPPPMRRPVAPTPGDPRPLDPGNALPTPMLLDQSGLSVQEFLAQSAASRSVDPSKSVRSMPGDPDTSSGRADR